MAVLLMLNGAHIGSRYELEHTLRPVITIGRGGSTIVVLDQMISQRHAQLTYNDGSWMIEDLGSTHGTYVNSTRITEPVVIKNDDQIRCGQTIIIFLEQCRNAVSRAGKTESVKSASIAASSSNTTQIPCISEPTVPQPKFVRGSFELIENINTAIADIGSDKELLASVGWHLLCRPEVDCVFILIKNSSNAVETAVELSKRHDLEYAMISGIIKKVLTDEKPILIDNISSNAAIHAEAGKASTESVLAAPIRNRQSISGLIYLGSAKPDAFSPEQVNVINYLGGHIGLALENLQLSEAARKNQKFMAAGQSTVNLSHSIKNVIQAITGAAEVIDYAFKKDQIDKAKNSWEILKNNVDRLKKFTLDMLAFNRDTKPIFTNCMLNRIVESAVESLRQKAKEKGVSIILEMDDRIPVRPMDSDNMHDVVLNLVMNAIDAVDAQKGIINIITWYDALKQFVGFSVKDNGPGISNEEREKIWLPFHTTKSKGGTGLGLPIVRKIVDQHGGVITLDSQPGCGAKFTVALPAKHEQSAFNPS